MIMRLATSSARSDPGSRLCDKKTGVGFDGHLAHILSIWCARDVSECRHYAVAKRQAI